jgi:hypothetical protein
MVGSLKLVPGNKCTVPAVLYQESLKPMGVALSQRVIPHAEVAISFTMPFSSNVKLGIYSVDGQLQKTLVSRPLSAGKHFASWDRTDLAGRKVASGIYIYRFTMGDYKLSKHFMLTK